MKRYILIAAASLVIVACDDPDLITPCQPTTEICDNVDNDCDGRIDENLSNVADCGGCNDGELSCVRGEFVCLGASEPQPEICDGVDNDCDDQIDEPSDLIDKPDPSGLCYTYQDQTTVLFGQCRAGLWTCNQGGYSCVGEIGPASELCGDGLDNDCDGAVDEVTDVAEQKPVDIVWVVDCSASMLDVIRAVGPAIEDFLRLNADNARFNYWMLDLPGQSDPARAWPNQKCHPNTSLGSPLESCTRDNMMIAAQSLTTHCAGQEPSYDAVLDIVTTGMIKWSDPDSIRVIVFFGDEEGQTVRNIDEAIVATKINRAKPPIKFFGFVHPQHWTSYDTLASASGGALFSIFQSQLRFTEDFQSHLTPPCDTP